MDGVRGPRRLDLAPAVRAELERIVRDGPAGVARRARIVLARADGHSLSVIAGSVGRHRDSVRRWLIRFQRHGLEGLQHGNSGKPRNVVFTAPIREEIRRRANTAPAVLGEWFSTWSLYRLQEHLIRHGVVRSISIERLRQLLANGACARQYWHYTRAPLAPLPPEIRDQLLAIASHAEQQSARRARAVLAVAEGSSLRGAAAGLRVGKTTLCRWLADFRVGGLAGFGGLDRVPPRPSAPLATLSLSGGALAYDGDAVGNGEHHGLHTRVARQEVV